jgi:transcriptional regulator
MTLPKKPSPPVERTQTPRAAIREALLGRAVSAHELSRRAGVREKDVAAHLEHLERSTRSRGERLVVTPAACLACGFVFRERKRLTSPGACPRCRSEHVAAPTFRIERRDELPALGRQHGHRRDTEGDADRAAEGEDLGEEERGEERGERDPAAEDDRAHGGDGAA